MRIPLSSPDVSGQEIEMVAAVLGTLQLSPGPKLKEFENAGVNCIGTEHAIGVSSGTTGLRLCVRALGISTGDEVCQTLKEIRRQANGVGTTEAEGPGD